MSGISGSSVRAVQDRRPASQHDGNPAVAGPVDLSSHNYRSSPPTSWPFPLLRWLGHHHHVQPDLSRQRVALAVASGCSSGAAADRGARSVPGRVDVRVAPFLVTRGQHWQPGGRRALCLFMLALYRAWDNVGLGCGPDRRAVAWALPFCDPYYAGIASSGGAFVLTELVDVSAGASIRRAASRGRICRTCVGARHCPYRRRQSDRWWAIRIGPARISMHASYTPMLILTCWRSRASPSRRISASQRFRLPSRAFMCAPRSQAASSRSF